MNVEMCIVCSNHVPIDRALFCSEQCVQKAHAQRGLDQLHSSSSRSSSPDSAEGSSIITPPPSPSLLFSSNFQHQLYLDHPLVTLRPFPPRPEMRRASEPAAPVESACTSVKSSASSPSESRTYLGEWTVSKEPPSSTTRGAATITKCNNGSSSSLGSARRFTDGSVSRPVRREEEGAWGSIDIGTFGAN
ncbi:uncharacterized protein VTP21DRAFT_11291 [Calcarisporiella thermophila]|uniref:uncharacterized protein n=1 Tax=Calcarisporiella thermophila TaxID=911321 RepID=UPI0037433D49